MDPRRARTQGLQRVSRLTAWMAGGAVVVSGAFVALLARPHLSTAQTRTPLGAGGATTTLDPFGGGGSVDDGGAAAQPLNPPVQAPLPSAGPAQVSSGAS